MILGHMAVHSLNCCRPETEGDTRPWQYTVWTDIDLSETEGDARSWQYTFWTDICLRLYSLTNARQKLDPLPPALTTQLKNYYN